MAIGYNAKPLDGIVGGYNKTEGGVLMPDISRRKFLIGAGAGALAAACSTNPVGRGLHDLVNDYRIFVFDNSDKPSIIEYGVKGEGEERAWNFLSQRRDDIERVLGGYIDEGTLDTFARQLYDDRDANRAGFTLYHSLNKIPDADRLNVRNQLRNVGVDVEAYTDVPAVIALSLLAAAATYGILSGIGVIGGSSAGAASGAKFVPIGGGTI